MVNQRRLLSRTSCTGAFTASASALTYSGSVTTKTITDVQTPGFQRLLRCGKFLPINPVTIETITETRYPGSCPHVFTSGGCVKSYYDPDDAWGYLAPGVSLPPFDEDIVSYVTNAAIANCKSATWDALTFVGETKQTAEFVEDQIGRIKRAAMWIARKSRSRSKRTSTLAQRLDLFGSLWLEYRYSWQTSVYDIRDATTALKRKLDSGELIDGRAQQTADLSESNTRVLTIGNGHQTVTDIIDGTRHYRGFAYSEVVNGARATFAFDPLVTSWELLRFSFVIDWLVDVNSYLQAVSPFSGCKLLASGCSVKDTYRQEQYVTTTFDNPVGHSGEGTYSTKFEVERYTRFPSGISLPSWNPRLNSVRVVDLLSLIFGMRSAVQRILR